MKLRLEGQGKRIVESSTDSLPSEVWIGRGAQCQWRIPSDYKMAGSRHARLVREGTRFFLEDLNSRNGTFCDGRRITREEVRPGRQFSIAGCLQLIVEEEPVLSPNKSEGKKRLSGSRGPRLVGWTSALRDRVFPLNASPFIVGTAADAALRLSDPLISMRHAEIIRKDDGTYWLRDLNSVNGTLVNDRSLDKDESVRLHHRDRLFFAHYGVIFDDGRGLLTERYIWLIGFALVAVFLAAVSIARLHMRPTPERVVKKALLLAKKEKFDLVFQLLTNYPSDEKQGMARETRDRLEKWGATYKAWGNVTTALAQGDWSETSKALKTIAIHEDDAWSWSESGLARQREAMAVAALLTAFLELSTQAQDPYAPDQEATVAALSAALRGSVSLTGGYLDPLRKQAESLLSKIQQRIEMERKFDCLDKLNAWPPPLAEVMNVLKERQLEETGAARDYVDRLLNGLNVVLAELSRYEEAKRCLEELEWDCLDRSSSVVSLASVDARVKAAFDRIARRSRLVHEMARLAREAQSLTTDGANLSKSVQAWADKDALKEVLACDTAVLGYIDPDRSQPLGQYDRYVGVEDFYDFCIKLTGEHSLRPLITPFKTELAWSRDYYSRLKALLHYVDGEGREEFLALSGAFPERMEVYRTELVLRQTVIRDLRKDAAGADEQRALIAAVIVLQLAEQPEAETLPVNGKNIPLKDWAILKFARVREKIPH